MNRDIRSWKNFKGAFTLAEVLITLGIIGVVAAMTMPTLITSHKNKVYETQFKAAHSLVSQAVVQMAEEVFDISSYYCGTTRRDKTENVFIQDFAKYFQVVNSVYEGNRDLTILGYQKTNFNQAGRGWNGFNIDGHDDGTIFLKNGMMIASGGCWWNPKFVDFVVDTNGIKGPNKFGYDVFYFQVGENNKLYPSAGNFMLNIYNTDEQMLRCCDFNVTSSACSDDNGSSCALFALQNRSPHDSTKGYWESLP